MYTRTWAQTVGGSRPGATIGRVGEVIVHTEAGATLGPSATMAQEIRRLRDIHAFHRSLGWAGFGYSVMVCQSGRVYEGRGLHRSGAHTQGRNRTALAIVIPGHGDRDAMSDAAVAAARRWIGWAIAQGAVSAAPAISGHRDYAAKSCPGDRVYPQLGRLRSVTAAPVFAPTPPPAQEDPLMALSDREQRELLEAARSVLDRDRGGRLGRELRVTKEAVGRIEQQLGGRNIGLDLRALRLAARGVLAKLGVSTRNDPPDVYDV